MEKKSKFLSLILRHKPDSVNIKLDKNGWALCSEIIKVLAIDITELHTLVKCNNKQRFELSDDKTKIRARQGHSIDVDVELEDVTNKLDFPLYHGTKKKNLNIILQEGLKKMNRQHVHLTKDYNVAAKRAGVNGVILSINVNMQQVWKSRNDVYLMNDILPINIIGFNNV